MRQIPKTRLAAKYADELHCNEIMLLPYYVASMNIEHAYYEVTGNYEPFEGICLVDTFELAEAKQPFTSSPKKTWSGWSGSADPDLRHHRQSAL